MAIPINQIDLPEDVIYEILLRLPVRSLLKFKCVCKCWCALFESPGFINRHYVHESNQERLLMWHCRLSENYTIALPLDVSLCKYEEPTHLRVPGMIYRLMGPVNGIYCLLPRWRRIALWNPAREQFRPLSFCQPENEPPLYDFNHSVGFGMDMQRGDYKVVLIQRLRSNKEDVQKYPSIVSVYRSGSDSWSHFKDALVNSTASTYRSAFNTYLNGIFYWLTGSDEDYLAILTFDMTGETFQQIDLPDRIGPIKMLSVYGDSVALLSHERGSKYTIWVLEKEGGWIKKFSFGPMGDIILQRPIVFWKFDELLFQTKYLDMDLYLFNIKTSKLRNVEIAARPETDPSWIYWVHMYKESLFSLNKEGIECGPFDASSVVKDWFFKPTF